MVNAFVLVTPLTVPEMVAVTVELTTIVDTVNDAELEPPGIVIVAGTLATELLDESETVSPPAGAGPERTTVPVDVAPPTTEPGENVNPRNTGGAMINP